MSANKLQAAILWSGFAICVLSGCWLLGLFSETSVYAIISDSVRGQLLKPGFSVLHFLAAILILVHVISVNRVKLPWSRRAEHFVCLLLFLSCVLPWSKNIWWPSGPDIFYFLGDTSGEYFGPRLSPGNLSAWYPDSFVQARLAFGLQNHLIGLASFLVLCSYLYCVRKFPSPRKIQCAHPVCSRCGYDTTGLEQCPECGFQPTVSMKQLGPSSAAEGKG
jgi:hypothetical protein